MGGCGSKADDVDREERRRQQEWAAIEAAAKVEVEKKEKEAAEKKQVGESTPAAPAQPGWSNAHLAQANGGQNGAVAGPNQQQMANTVSTLSSAKEEPPRDFTFDDLCTTLQTACRADENQLQVLARWWQVVASEQVQHRAMGFELRLEGDGSTAEVMILGLSDEMVPRVPQLYDKLRSLLDLSHAQRQVLVLALADLRPTRITLWCRLTCLGKPSQAGVNIGFTLHVPKRFSPHKADVLRAASTKSEILHKTIANESLTEDRGWSGTEVSCSLKSDDAVRLSLTHDPSADRSEASSDQVEIDVPLLQKDEGEEMDYEQYEEELRKRKKRVYGPLSLEVLSRMLPNVPTETIQQLQKEASSMFLELTLVDSAVNFGLKLVFRGLGTDLLLDLSTAGLDRTVLLDAVFVERMVQVLTGHGAQVTMEAVCCAQSSVAATLRVRPLPKAPPPDWSPPQLSPWEKRMLQAPAEPSAKQAYTTTKRATGEPKKKAAIGIGTPPSHAPKQTIGAAGTRQAPVAKSSSSSSTPSFVTRGSSTQSDGTQAQQRTPQPIPSYSTLLASSQESSAHAELRPGMEVQLTGLQAAPHLNGEEGTLIKFDASSGRWRVSLFNGESKDVKPENLVTPELMPGPKSSGPGHHQGSSSEKDVDPLFVKPPIQSSPQSSADVDLRPGMTVQLSGLSAQHLNGEEGTLIGFDGSSGRWRVCLFNGETKDVKAENLRTQDLLSEAKLPDTQPGHRRGSKEKGTDKPTVIFAEQVGPGGGPRPKRKAI